MSAESVDSEPWSTLVALADAHGDQIADSWQRSSVTVRDGLVAAELLPIAAQTGFTVQLLYGDGDLPLTLRPAAEPDTAEMAALRTLLGNETAQAELTATASFDDAIRLLQPQFSGAFVQYSMDGWVRTEAAFLAAIHRDWLEVASSLPTDHLRCGSTEIGLQAVGSLDPPGALRSTVPAVSSSLSEPMHAALAALADASAWTQLAVRSTIDEGRLLVALHHDQDPAIEVSLAGAVGGVELLRWRLGDSPSNREEALRYVLRFVTASSATLPNAITVRTLSQRQFIALARDRAAEVVRAISDAQKTTADVLAKAIDSLSSLVEDTTTTASATVAAVIGVVALVVQNGNLVPGWVILLATVVAAGGVVAVMLSRWRRIQDQVDAVALQKQRLDNDPLLPDDERRWIAKSLSTADISQRATTARRRVVILGVAASAVALAAAIWLVARPGTSHPSPSTPTTSTSTLRSP